MALQSRKKQAELKSKFIHVGKYRNPQSLMQLMARISSTQVDDDINIFWRHIENGLHEKVAHRNLSEFLSDGYIRSTMVNMDFAFELHRLCEEAALSLTSKHRKESTSIVVAGGFSSGKSSFINQLSQSGGLLPTGVEPVSVVKTYLHFSRDCQGVTLKGINHRNAIVEMDTDVLKVLRHGSESNIYLASVLNHLFIDIHSDVLDGFVFVDTPGYNNSDMANSSNGVTDKETAISTIKNEGNILFWLIDIVHGTIKSEDLEIIKQFNGEKLIIFNKADKQGIEESTKIVKHAVKVLESEGIQDVIDVLAYSSQEEKVYYSSNKYTLTQIISNIKNKNKGQAYLSELREKIKKLFINEERNCEAQINRLEEKRRNCIEDQNYWDIKLRNILQNRGKNSKNEELSTSIKKELKMHSSIVDKILIHFQSFVRKVEEYNEKKFFSVDMLTTQTSLAEQKIQKLGQELSLSRGRLSDHMGKIQPLCIELSDRDKEKQTLAEEWVNLASRQYNSILDEREHIKDRQNDISRYKENFLKHFDMGIDEYNESQELLTPPEKSDIHTAYNVFTCISNKDKEAFFDCFAHGKGVDVYQCNDEGYTPLTYAVRMGDNSMVDFLLDNGADPHTYDGRGYNAMHTAVENNYRDICEILIKHDRNLLNTKTRDGQDLEDLTKRHTFENWIREASQSHKTSMQ